jgi:hypothetical protein
VLSQARITVAATSCLCFDWRGDAARGRQVGEVFFGLPLLPEVFLVLRWASSACWQSGGGLDNLLGVGCDAALDRQCFAGMLVICTHREA